MKVSFVYLFLLLSSWASIGQTGSYGSLEVKNKGLFTNYYVVPWFYYSNIKDSDKDPDIDVKQENGMHFFYDKSKIGTCRSFNQEGATIKVGKERKLDPCGENGYMTICETDLAKYFDYQNCFNVKLYHNFWP